jgi:hypothetical protein
MDSVKSTVLFFRRINMVVRLRIVLEQEEYSALLRLAISEERNPEGQLRFILRTVLHNRGLLILPPESDSIRNEENDNEPKNQA